MISIYVFSKSLVTIDSTDHSILDKDEMISFLRILLDKVAFSGERFCLESADIVDKPGDLPTVKYTEVKRWGF